MMLYADKRISKKKNTPSAAVASRFRVLGTVLRNNRVQKKLEARVGFEPTSDGFSDHSLRPLGYRALFVMPKIYAQSALFLPIYAVERLANPLIPRDAGRTEGFCRPL